MILLLQLLTTTLSSAIGAASAHARTGAPLGLAGLSMGTVAGCAAGYLAFIAPRLLNQEKSMDGPRDSRTGGRIRIEVFSWIVAVAASGLFAAARESALAPLRADLALIAGVLAIDCAFRRTLLSRVLSAVCCGIGGFCDLTTLLWPLALLWTGPARGLPGALALVLGSLLALAFGAGDPTTIFVRGGVHSIQRDVTLLLPLVLLGWAGWSRCRRYPAWLPAWTMFSTAGLMLCILGVPLQARLCALPAVVLAPGALVELRGLICSGRHVSRIVGFAGGLVILVLAWPSVAACSSGIWILLAPMWR